MDYRHELKYVITAAQQALLENRIQGLIKPDSHVGADGMYHIRSLYFDDFLLYDTNAGTTVTPPSTDDMPTPPTGENPLYAVVAMMCAAASGIAVIQMKRRAGRR